MVKTVMLVRRKINIFLSFSTNRNVSAKTRRSQPHSQLKPQKPFFLLLHPATTKISLNAQKAHSRLPVLWVDRLQRTTQQSCLEICRFALTKHSRLYPCLYLSK